MTTPGLIASKLVDIQKGLQDLQIGLPHLVFDKSIVVGKATRLAANIRTLEVIKPADRLDYMAVEIGITPNSLKTEILPILEQHGMVQLHRGSSGKLERIEENVPSLQELLRTSGKYWTELEPSNREIAGVDMLTLLSATPMQESELKTRCMSSLSERDSETVITCAESGNLVGEYESKDHEAIMYSPLIWSLRANEAMKYYARLQTDARDSIRGLVQQIQEYPGMPESLVSVRDEAYQEALRTGFLEKGSTMTKAGTYGFLFMPDERMKLKSEGVEQGDLFDKVKAIISAVRHGQHHAPVWKIKYPVFLLQQLLDRGYLKPYSGAREQYALLELKGIVKFREYDGMWITEFIDSKENREAMQAAIDILKTGEPLTYTLQEETARAILVDGFFVDPFRNRSRVARTAKVNSAYIESYLEGMRGESYDLPG